MSARAVMRPEGSGKHLGGKIRGPSTALRPLARLRFARDDRIFSTDARPLLHAAQPMMP